MPENDHNSPDPSPVDPLTVGELISLAEAAQFSGLSSEYLRITAVKGRLKAKKVGSQWVTTQAAIKEYLNSRKFIYPKDKTP